MKPTPPKKRMTAKEVKAWNKLENMRRRVSRARHFPMNTCPASRHLHSIADALTSKQRKHSIEELWSAEHMAGTMYSVLESLWKARTDAAARSLP
jgi:hypothetical protein